MWGVDYGLLSRNGVDKFAICEGNIFLAVFVPFEQPNFPGKEAG
jgi:hypothetical protein